MIFTTYDGENKAGLGSLLQLQLLLNAYGKMKNENIYFPGFEKLGHVTLSEAQKINNFFCFLLTATYVDNAKKIDERFLVKYFAEFFLMKKKSLMQNLSNFGNYTGERHYSENEINVALHIRTWNAWDSTHSARQKSSIVRQRQMYDPSDQNDSIRNYYLGILKKYIQKEEGKEYKIHVYSEGAYEDFKFLENIPNIAFHINCPIVDTFYHLVHADILVASKSSLSWSAHLFGKNKLVIARRDFWHSWYPDTTLLTEHDGAKSPFYKILFNYMKKKLAAIIYLVFYPKFTTLKHF